MPGHNPLIRHSQDLFFIWTVLFYVIVTIVLNYCWLFCLQAVFIDNFKNYKAQVCAPKTSIISATFWNICTNHVEWAECHANSLCFYGFTIIVGDWAVRWYYLFSRSLSNICYYEPCLCKLIIYMLFSFLTNFTSINFTFDIDFRNGQFNC